MKNSEENDIKDFEARGHLIHTVSQPQEAYPWESTLKQIGQRSSIYLEFMAAAFLKETGIPASEAELIVTRNWDETKISYRFQAINRTELPPAARPDRGP